MEFSIFIFFYFGKEIIFQCFDMLIFLFNHLSYIYDKGKGKCWEKDVKKNDPIKYSRKFFI